MQHLAFWNQKHAFNPASIPTTLFSVLGSLQNIFVICALDKKKKKEL